MGNSSLRPFLLVVAVVGVLAFAASPAAAQFTWNNPNGGNWVDGTNWVGNTAPTAGATTSLTFGSGTTAAASYTASNNIGSVPFNLNALTFNGNAGTLVTLNGNGLNFTGSAPMITMGAGNATIVSPTTFTASTTVGGGSGTLTFNGSVTASATGLTLAQNSTGSLVLAGGGSFDTLSVQKGSASATGGTLALTAPTDIGNLTSGLQLGSAAGQTASFTASGGAKVNVMENVYVGDAAGSTGTLTVTGSGTVLDGTIGGMSGRMGIGNNGAGSLSITNGGVVRTIILSASRNAGAGTSSVLVDGNNSSLTVGVAGSGTTGILSVGITNTSTMTVSNGASVVVNEDGAFFVGRAAGGNGTVNVQSGGTMTLNPKASGSAGPAIILGNVAGSSGTMTVSDANSLVTVNSALLAPSELDIAVGASTDTTAGPTGSVTVQNGGKVTIDGNSFIGIFRGTGPSPATGSVTVTGTGSQLTVTGSVITGGGGGTGVLGGAGNLTVQNGGALVMDAAVLAQNPSGTSIILVDGTGSTLTATSILILGGGNTAGGTASLTVSNGATVSAPGGLFLYAGGTANINAGGIVTTAAVGDGDTGNVGNIVTQTGGVLTITGVAGQIATYSGVISGGGSVVVNTGTGLQEFAAANTYTGGTTINGGVLSVTNTTGSGTGSGPVTVNNGGTLAGPGIITGNVTVASGGTLTGGPVSTGILRLTGATLLAPGSTLSIGIDGTTAGSAATGNHDQIALGTTGVITLTGATLSTGPITNGTYVPSPTDVVFVILGTGTGTQVVGTFGNAPPGPGFLAGTFGGRAYTATVTYATNSVMLSAFTPVPEPMFVLLACGAAAMVSWRRGKT